MDVTVDMTTLRGDDVALSDYGITPPVGFMVLSIADQGTIEVHLLFTQAA